MTPMLSGCRVARTPRLRATVNPDQRPSFEIEWPGCTPPSPRQIARQRHLEWCLEATGLRPGVTWAYISAAWREKSHLLHPDFASHDFQVRRST